MATAYVHKRDCEGALIIDAFTGEITSPPAERPEWSDGLATALLAERLRFYETRLGPNLFTQSMKLPEAYAFEDLGWLAVDAAGTLVELEADSEHRMTQIAEIVGMTRPDSLSDEVVHTKGKVIASGQLAFDADRTDEEAHALEKAQASDFDTVRKTA